MDAADASFISSSYWTDGVGPAAALACIGKMQRLGTHDESQIQSLLTALDETFTTLDALAANGQLQTSAGDVKTSQGFGRLA